MAFNDELANKFTRHAVDLSRFAAWERNRALKLLADVQAELVAELASRQLTTYQEARTQSLLKQIRETIATGLKGVRRQVFVDLYGLAKIESDFVRATINRTSGIELASTAVSGDQLRAIVGNAMLNGAPQAEWWDRQTKTMQNQFADSLRTGLLEGETTGAIVRRVRGTFELAARNVEALVRTGAASVSTAARVETYVANDDVISAVQQRSTLDGRTTQICIAYSGLAWTVPDFEPIDHNKPWNGGPPRHFNCRSTAVPIVRAFSKMSALKTGGRSTDADAYFQSRLADQGLSPDEIDRAIADAQASMDGQIPDDWNYETWLNSKPESFQKDVLGPSKWKLWKDGKLSFTELVDQSGRPLSVEQLKDAYA